MKRRHRTQTGGLDYQRPTVRDRGPRRQVSFEPGKIIPRGRHGNGGEVDEFGCMPCRCWCENHTMSVPAEMIRSGATLSCGAPRCVPSVSIPG